VLVNYVSWQMRNSASGLSFEGVGPPSQKTNKRFTLCAIKPIIHYLVSFLFIDLDGDGLQDTDEPPLAGVKVKLYDDAGQQVTSAITDDYGFYGFTV
jgi:hypothetical protein